MNKQERNVYVVLADEMDSPVGCFCKFSECETGNSPCDCGEPLCKHPLGDRLEVSHHSEYLGPGQDCWGFRQEHPVDFCADITGICLSKGWLTAVWWQNKKKQWKVAELRGEFDLK